MKLSDQLIGQPATRRTLATRSLSSYGLGRDAIYSFNQDFQALLPRSEYTDALALRSVWKAGVGTQMWTELLKYESVSNDKINDITLYYERSEVKWTGDWRPKKEQPSYAPVPKNPKHDTAPAHKQPSSLMNVSLHALTTRVKKSRARILGKH